MEFFLLNGGSSSSRKGTSDQVKVKESDLLRRVGEECCDDEEESLDAVVDCRLSLGLSSSSSAVVNHGRRPRPAGVRKCLMCGKTETPLWRNGPNGAKSLCNACGIRFKKEEKRASLMLQGKPNSSSNAKMQSIGP